MCILFYAEKMDLIGNKLRKIMTSEGCGDNLQVYKNFEELTLRLHKPKRDCRVMVLLPADKNELLSFLLIRDMLADVPIILILPDQSKEIIDMGYKLFPRFISYKDSDLTDVSGVINRILTNYNCSDLGGSNEAI